MSGLLTQVAVYGPINWPHWYPAVNGIHHDIDNGDTGCAGYANDTPICNLIITTPRAGLNFLQGRFRLRASQGGSWLPWVAATPITSGEAPYWRLSLSTGTGGAFALQLSAA
jgi:hypothetical protein